MMEAVEPYDMSQAVDFQTAYLAGYLADKYDVDAEESIQRANERIKKSTEDAFAATVMGYNTVVPVSSNIRLNNGRARYALYPVWILNTIWNGQKFTFAAKVTESVKLTGFVIDSSKGGPWTGLAEVEIYGMEKLG